MSREQLSLAVREAKRSDEKIHAPETGACAYNQSGIISGDLFGINLAFVARIPANNPLSDGTKQRGKKI